MERRREQRITAGKAARITVLATDSGQDRVLEGVLENVSGRGAMVRCSASLRPDTAIRIDIGDVMLLGEVCHCTWDGKAWVAGIELQQAVNSMTDLSRLVAGVMGEHRETAQRETKRARVAR